MDLKNLAWVKGKEIDLFIESFSNAVRTVQIRGITKEEQIIGNHITEADRSLATSVIRITDIPIFLTARAAANSVSRGELYVKVSLRVDQVVVALLFAGYVTDAGAPIHPNGKIESSVEGPGLIRSITVTDPAAGAEILETVPTGARWLFKSLQAFFTADANVATRTPILFIDDGATEILRISTNTTLAASQTIRTIWGAWPIQGDNSGANSIGPLIPDLHMAAGFRLSTVVINLQAGDDWSLIQLLVEEWLEP